MWLYLLLHLLRLLNISKHFANHTQIFLAFLIVLLWRIRRWYSISTFAFIRWVYNLLYSFSKQDTSANRSHFLCCFQKTIYSEHNLKNNSYQTFPFMLIPFPHYGCPNCWAWAVGTWFDQCSHLLEDHSKKLWIRLFLPLPSTNYWLCSKCETSYFFRNWDERLISTIRVNLLV